jgi:catechol 2,3-dioxygenase-like lactoylglutathione lyase family enzyme
MAMGMFKLTGLNHLALATGDMDKTIHFWRDLLGMRLVVGLGKPGYRQYFFQLSESELITFFEWPEVKSVPYKRHGDPVTGPFIFDHVSFSVDKEEDLWELIDKLEAADFPVSDVIDHGFIHSIYTYDPNGIPLEFSHNVEGVDIRKNPLMADKKPSSTSMEGPDPVAGRWPEVEEPAPEDDRMIIPGEGSGLFD